MPDYRIVELNSFAALQEAVQRGGFQGEALQTEFFYSSDWFSNLAEHGIGAESNLLLLLVTSTPTGPAVCLPLQYSASGLASLSNYYSSLFGPIVWNVDSTHPVSADVWHSVAKHLRQRVPRQPLLTLSPLDTQTAFYREMPGALRAAHHVADHYLCFGNWYLEVAGRSFAEYAQALPAALRNSIARGQRRLSRQGAWDIRIQSCADESLEASIQAFVQVYQNSWKKPEPHPHFIPQLVRMAAAHGWLRLGILTLQGQAIAAQLWLLKSGKASIFKLAYVEGFERFSAGSVLTHALMQHVVDIDGVHEVDYLTGDDAYKRDWMSHRRERFGIIAFDLRTPKGIWAAARHFGGKLLRRQHT